MTTRAKPKEMVVEGQRVFDVIANGGKWIAIPLAAFTVIFATVWSINEHSSKEGSLETRTVANAQQQSEAMLLHMAPGGKSKRTPVPFMKRVVMSGKDFRYHCLYADGHEESFVPGEKPCSDGDLPLVYASNLRPNEPNDVAISYADPSQ